MVQSERKYSIEKINHKVKVKNGEFNFLTSGSCPLFDFAVVHSADVAAGPDSVWGLRYEQRHSELN